MANIGSDHQYQRLEGQRNSDKHSSSDSSFKRGEGEVLQKGKQKGIWERIKAEISEWWQGHQENMKFSDKILMGPIEKYQVYQQFPWKLVVHVLLIIATSV